jgi:hypothetical protein
MAGGGMSICPLCKGSRFGVVRSNTGVYVECLSAPCPWTQTPSDETVIDAATATWHRENPMTKVDFEAAMKDVSYSLYWDDCLPTGWRIFRVGFSGRSVADPRIWAKSDRAAAEAALAEFVREKEAA